MAKWDCDFFKCWLSVNEPIKHVISLNFLWKKRVVRYSFQIFDNKLLKNLPTLILVSGKLWKAFSQLTVISTESGILMMPSSKQSFLHLFSEQCLPKYFSPLVPCRIRNSMVSDKFPQFFIIQHFDVKYFSLDVKQSTFNKSYICW